jgi:hypothetical protein
MNAFVFQVICACPFGDFCFWQILLQKALPLNPPERAAALERSAGDACAIPKTLDQFRTPMVDEQRTRPCVGAAYDHLRRASIVPRGADYRKATGS